MRSTVAALPLVVVALATPWQVTPERSTRLEGVEFIASADLALREAGHVVPLPPVLVDHQTLIGATCLAGSDELSPGGGIDHQRAGVAPRPAVHRKTQTPTCRKVVHRGTVLGLAPGRMLQRRDRPDENSGVHGPLEMNDADLHGIDQDAGNVLNLRKQLALSRGKPRLEVTDPLGEQHFQATQRHRTVEVCPGGQRLSGSVVLPPQLATGCLGLLSLLLLKL